MRAAVAAVCIAAACAVGRSAEDHHAEHLVSLMCRGGPIVPTPQHAHYTKGTLRPGRLCVVPGTAAQPPERLAAEELAERLSALAALAGDTAEIVFDPAPDALPSFDTVLAIGTRRGNPYLSMHSARWRLPAPSDYPGREGYRIRCLEDSGQHVIACVGYDGRGVLYAAQSVLQLFEAADGEVLFHPAEVTDWPATGWRGAKLIGWSAKTPDTVLPQLRFAIRWMAAAKYNHIHISYPKSGMSWRDPPRVYRQHVADVCEYCSPRGLGTCQFVNPFVGEKGPRSPNSKIVISDPEELDALEATFRLSIDKGGTAVMLCMDDFVPVPWPPYRLTNEADLERFGNVTDATVLLIAEMKKRLEAVQPGLDFVYCPPWFCTVMVTGMADEIGEVARLAAAIPEDVSIIWTGRDVRSIPIWEQHLLDWIEYTGSGRKPFIWDNTFYERRFEGSHIGTFVLFDPWRTRYPERFWERVEGVHINNGNHDDVALAGLLDISNYLWNPQAYNTEESRRACIRIVAGDEAVEPIVGFRETFYELFRRVPSKASRAFPPNQQAFEEQVAGFSDEELAQLVAYTQALRRQYDIAAAHCDNARVTDALRECVEGYEGLGFAGLLAQRRDAK